MAVGELFTKNLKSWIIRNIWKKLFEYFKQEPDMEWVAIDSTIVRAHARSAGYGKNSQAQESLGRSKGGFTTKIHALVFECPSRIADVDDTKEITLLTVARKQKNDPMINLLLKHGATE